MSGMFKAWLRRRRRGLVAPVDPEAFKQGYDVGYEHGIEDGKAMLGPRKNEHVDVIAEMTAGRIGSHPEAKPLWPAISEHDRRLAGEVREWGGYQG